MRRSSKYGKHTQEIGRRKKLESQVNFKVESFSGSLLVETLMKMNESI